MSLTPTTPPIIGVSRRAKRRPVVGPDRSYLWGEIYGHVASDEPGTLLYVGSSLNGKESRRASHRVEHWHRYWATAEARGASVLQIGLEHYLCVDPSSYAPGEWNSPCSPDLQGRKHLILDHACRVWSQPVPGNTVGVDGRIAAPSNLCENPELPLPELSPAVISGLTQAQWLGVTTRRAS